MTIGVHLSQKTIQKFTEIFFWYFLVPKYYFFLEIKFRALAFGSRKIIDTAPLAPITATSAEGHA